MKELTNERATHDVHLHRAIGSDEWLVAMPDVAGELIVTTANSRELKSYRRLQKLIIEQQMRVISRKQWLMVKARL